jgi:myo-inositol-1(or 4)-monophosphatase
MHQSPELVFAVKATRACKDILIEGFGNNIYAKKSPEELITQTDLACEETIKKILTERFPQYGFFSEEKYQDKPSEETYWVVDPLDGTTNFVKGVPRFSSIVTLIKKRTPVVTAIFDPINDQMYTAEKDKGAFVNGNPIHVSEVRELIDSFIEFDAGYGHRRKLGSFFTQTGDKIRQPSFFSPSSMQCVDVAIGIAEGFVRIFSMPSDVDCGMLLVKEAGGKATRLDGKTYYRGDKHVLLSNGNIHKELVEEFSPISLD